MDKAKFFDKIKETTNITYIENIKGGR
jgi:hypothetical protein